MSNLSRPLARMMVASGLEQEVRYDGFAQYDMVDDLLQRSRCRVNMVDPGAGSGAVTAAMAVAHSDLRCVVARPILDTGQSLGLGHFDTRGGQWIGLHKHGLDKEVKLYQSDGRAGQITGLVSRFTFPANPVFCVSLYRAEPGPDCDWAAGPPYTELHFGIGERDEWALAFPYGSALSLLRNRGGGWEKVAGAERTVHLPSLEGYAKGQRLFLWVGVWDGKLVVSTDGFAGDTWVYTVPGESILVRQGKIALWHNAGQWMASVFGMKMPTAVLDSCGIDAGYETRNCTASGVLNYRHLPAVDSERRPLSAVEVADSTALRDDLLPTQRSWRATIRPWVHSETNVGTDPDTGASVGFTTCVSPQLYSVQIGQYPALVAASAPSWADVSGELIEATGHHAMESMAARYDVSLDGAPESARAVRPWIPARVEVGWRDASGQDAYEPQISGYVVEAARELGPGGAARVEATLLDATLRLRDEKCDGRAPVFDGWPVTEVFAWVLDRCGIGPEARQIEDTGTILSMGAPERPLWQAELGRDWLEFLREVADFDYRAGLFCDGTGRFVKGCRYCRRLRTATDVARHNGGAGGACPVVPDWHLYTRSAAAPDPTKRGEVLRIVSREHGGVAAGGANYVTVSGLGMSGEPIRAVAMDVASIHDPTAPDYVGWRRMKVLGLQSYTTQAEVNRLAEETLRDASSEGHRVAITTDLAPGMRIGQVVEVHGGESEGLDGQSYRIASLTHHVNVGRGEVATTVVGACRIEADH